MSARKPASSPRALARQGIASGPMLLLALAALSAIVWLRRHEPSYSERVAPVRVAGETGRRVQARNFAIAVDAPGIQAARVLRAPRPNVFRLETAELRSAGLWLSVPAQIESLLETGMVSAQLRTRDGLVYRSSGDDRPKVPAVNLAARFVAPGLPEQGRYFFEIAPDRLEGLRLQAYWGGLTPMQNDALVDIDLGIDAARARALREGAGTIEVQP